jgi:hypothetical protein
MRVLGLFVGLGSQRGLARDLHDSPPGLRG